MNIVIFSDCILTNNVTAVSSKILTKIFKSHEHHVLVVIENTHSKYFEIDKNVVYVPISKRFKKINSYSYQQTLRKIKKFKPDVIHSLTNNQIGELGKSIAEDLDVEFVYSFNTHLEEKASIKSHGFLNRVARGLARRKTKSLGNQSSQFIVPSEEMKEYLRLTGCDAYINVITPVIDFPLFSEYEYNKEKKDAFFNVHHLNDKTKIVLLVGSLEKSENYAEILSMFASYFKGNQNDIRLLIINADFYTETINKKIGELGLSDKVILDRTNAYEEIPFYYSISNIYFTSSTTSISNIHILEAMAMKCYVLAKDSPAMRVYIDDDNTGFFYSSEETFEKKMNGIINLINEGSTKILDQAFLSLDKYSLENYYNQMIEVYQRGSKKHW